MANQFFVSCPMDCFDLCRFIVTVENNQIISLKGDPDHPLTRGVTCSKAKHLIARQNHPDRLTKPLLRTDKGFQPLSYDRVFDILTEKLTKVKNKYGNTAILNYTSDGYGGMKGRSQTIFMNYFGGDSRFSGSLCWSAGMAAQKYDFGTAMASNPLDVLNSDLVILWGRNPKVTNLHLYSLLKQAVKTGTKVIVIDPNRTDTAKAFDRHVQVKPGTDGALALGLAHILDRENLVNDAFVNQYVKGGKRFRQSLVVYTPEYVQSITGVDKGVIEELAIEYSKAKSASIYIGYGMQRYQNGGNSVRSINALAALCGNIGKSGNGIHYASKSLSPFIGRPEEDSERFVTEKRRFPAPNLGSFMASAQDPPIKLAFFSAGNPLVQTPDLTTAVNAMNIVPFKVVFDQFMTDTASMADIVLPAATVFEQEDIFSTSMYSHVMNYNQKALEPPETILPELDFYLILGKLLSLDYGFASSKEYLEQCADPLLEALNRQEKNASLKLDDLATTYPYLKDHDIAWADLKFSTPSGKIELYSDRAKADGLSPIANFTPPLEATKQFPLRLLTCHTKASMHSQSFLDTQKIPEISLHSKTATKYKLTKGETVLVKGVNGQIRATVNVDDTIHENTAFMYQGYWHKSGAVNFLTRERVTDMGNQAAYYDSFCCVIPTEP